MSDTKFPVTVLEHGEPLVIHTRDELHSFYAREYAQGNKVRNSRGEPEPNFSVQPNPEEYRRLRERR